MELDAREKAASLRMGRVSVGAVGCLPLAGGKRFYVFFQSYRGSGRAYSEKPAFSPIVVRYEWVLDQFLLPVMTLRFNLAYK